VSAAPAFIFSSSNIPTSETVRGPVNSFFVNDDFLILLAEDDEHDVILVKHAFMSADVVNPIHIVSNGEEAMAYLSGTGKYADRRRFPLPKLVLLDLKMPKVSGLEVLTWLRSAGENGLKRMPVIILSNSNEQSDIDRAYELGVNAYLVKPSGFGDLVDAVRSTTHFWKNTAAHPQF
jgi:CheY-like chemotaxis protein